MSVPPPDGRAGGKAAPGGTWTPLLTGPAARRAEDAASAIAEALEQPPDGWHPNPSLSDGQAGLALFYAYLALARGADGPADRAVELLGGALDATAEGGLPPTLYAGFPGVAWAVEHLRGRLLDAEEDDPVSAVDDILHALLEEHPGYLPATGGFDLVTGLVGLGVYALERLPRPWAEGFLGALVERLESVSERRPEGVAWWSDPRLLPPQGRELLPRGCYNLGVAHGTPGVVAFLGRVVAAGVAVPRARALLESAVAWLLAQRLPGGGFPRWRAPGESPEPARTAWCYGDPGIAVALLAAARGAGEESWEGEAVDLARAAARRPAEDSRVRDACLCHGAAGLGHLFNRLYQATGETELAAAARRWLERALDSRQAGAGVAGFLTWDQRSDGREVWVASPGFLNGAAGIGLALLAATTSVEPAWDRLLLASVAPRSRRA